MADCPEAKDDVEMGQGICYRCGSTEHSIQMCRAKVDPAMGKNVLLFRATQSFRVYTHIIHEY